MGFKMVESTDGAGGADDGGRSEDASGGGVSGPDGARDAMNEARDTADQSQQTRDTMSGAGGVLSDVADQVGGDNGPGPGEGSMDAAQASAMGGSDNDNDGDTDNDPGPGEGSVDAAQAAAMGGGNDAPGPGEGSMDAAQASAMEDEATREARASQERMEAEAKAALDSFNRRAQAQQVSEQLETAARAETYAADLLDANYTEITSVRAGDYGTTYDYYDTEAIAADMMAMSRTDPAMVEAAYETAIGTVGPQQGANLAAAVDALVEQERVATQTLLGGTTFEPQSLEALDAQATDLLEAHTSTGWFSGEPSVDVESLAYDVQQLAAQNPSLAVGLRSTLARSLDPVEAVELNRQIAGDRTMAERMELAVENPRDGATGAVKGLGNVVTGTFELIADGANLVDVGAYNAIGYGLEAVGATDLANRSFAAADYYGDVMAERDWSIPYDNPAQQGGGDFALVGELATGVVGAAKAGLRAGARQLDDVVDELAAEVPTAPATPGGVTPGMNYTQEVIDTYPYGQLLRDRVGPPPTDMFDPHAHHVVFKKGNGAAQQQLVQEAQQILRDYDIDPIYGEEVLDWAPNAVAGQHAIGALSPVVQDLRMLNDLGAPREQIVEMLAEYSRIAANRGQ